MLLTTLRDRSPVVIIEARAVARGSLRSVAARLQHLLSAPALAGLANSAADEGAAILMRAGVAGMSKQIAVQALEPTHRADRIVIGIRWVATGVTGDLFPALDGNLELRALDGGSTEVALIGSYRPPLGRTGEVIDQLVMGRVARRTVQSFVDRLATAVAEPEAAPAPVEVAPELS